MDVIYITSDTLGNARFNISNPIPWGHYSTLLMVHASLAEFSLLKVVNKLTPFIRHTCYINRDFNQFLDLFTQVVLSCTTRLI